VTAASGSTGQYDIIMSMDNSGSMEMNIDAPDNPSHPNLNHPTRMDTLKTVVTAFIAKMLTPGANNRLAANKWDVEVWGEQTFTSDNYTIQNFVEGMYPRFGTQSEKGLAAALAMSSQFRPGVVHAVILMTDGYNNSTNSDKKSIQICQQLKSQNPTTFVYTIAFGKDAVNLKDKKLQKRIVGLLSGCATGDPASNGGQDPKKTQYFFLAENKDALFKAFDSITTSIQGVRIVQ